MINVFAKPLSPFMRQGLIVENVDNSGRPLNEKKTLCIKFSSDGTLPCGKMKLNGKDLKWVSEAKHLGNWITNTLHDLIILQIAKKRNAILLQV